MVTQTADKLSHEEAFELLPWHVNSTLDEATSEKVARHIERCSTCQEETAILSNTILTLSAGETLATNPDAGFARVLGQVREYERHRRQQSRSDAQPLGERIAGWLGLATARREWATAFGLGLGIGLAALLVTLQLGEFGPDAPPVYETHSAAAAPLRLRIEFDRPPGASVLTALDRALAEPASWQRQSDTLYLVELSDDLTVKAVTDIRSRLLAVESVVTVDVDIVDPNTD